MYYLLKIDQVCREAPGKDAYSRWEKEKSKHKDPESVKDRIKDLYGKIPFREDSHKIYNETRDGDFHCGYTYSFWGEIGDRSTGPKKGWLTDWITIIKVEEKPVENLSDWEQ